MIARVPGEVGRGVSNWLRMASSKLGAKKYAQRRTPGDEGRDVVERTLLGRWMFAPWCATKSSQEYQRKRLSDTVTSVKRSEPHEVIGYMRGEAGKRELTQTRETSPRRRKGPGVLLLIILTSIL